MAVAPGAVSNVNSYTEIWETVVAFDVGATGAHTLKLGRGISGITRSAAGQFQVTFTDVGGYLLDLDISYESVAGTAPVISQKVADSLVVNAAGGGTALFEVWSVTTTPVRVDPVSGSDAVVTVRWLKTL